MCYSNTNITQFFKMVFSRCLVNPILQYLKGGGFEGGRLLVFVLFRPPARAGGGAVH